MNKLQSGFFAVTFGIGIQGAAQDSIKNTVLDTSKISIATILSSSHSLESDSNYSTLIQKYYPDMLQKYQQMDTNFIDTEERDIFYHITNKYLQRLHTSEERTLFLLIVLEDEKGLDKHKYFAEKYWGVVMDHPTMPKLLLEHNEECIRELNAYIRRKNALLKEIQKSIAIIIHKQNRISEENQRISLDKRSISALFQEREMKAKTPEEKAEVLENKKRMKELYDFCEQNNDKEQAQNTQQSMDVLKKVDKVLKGAIQDNISLKIIKDEIKPILEPKRTVRWLNRY